MNFQALADNWCALESSARVLIIADDAQVALARKIQHDLHQQCEIIVFDSNGIYAKQMMQLEPRDLVIALFAFETFVHNGANRVFSPFRKPKCLHAKYAFIRLGITGESLLQGLATPFNLIEDKIAELHCYPEGTRLHVTSASGTDLTLQIHPFETCEHCIVEDGGMAFLPPSETSSEVIPVTAEGRIVVDVTVGQLYRYGEFMGEFGLVDSPVTLEVHRGVILDITGGEMAVELKKKLFALDEACRTLVELGHGLSCMTPTGLIGVDESIIHTCHFGFGDGAICGVHLDLVVSRPAIVALPS